MAKTPEYTRRAIKAYEKGLVQKKLSLHKDKDKDIIDAIDNDKELLAPLIKRLLRDHYNLY